MKLHAPLAISALTLAFAPLAGCSSDDDPPCSGADCADAGADLADASTGTLPAVCNEGTRWEPGTSSFREVTEEWGLTGVQGTRLNVGDVNGDGWADLLIRRGGVRANDWNADGARHSWLLLNNGAGFDDFTEESGVDTPRLASPDNLGRPYEIAAFGDVDNDGDLDLYTGTTTVDAASLATRRRRS